MSQTVARPITAEDLYRFKMVSDPAYSPDGKQVAYVVTTIEEEINGYRSSIYLADTESHETRQLTRSTGRDSKPRWSPDCKQIAFLSNRADEKNQVWLIRANGGEAWKLSAFEDSVSEFCWSPDGSAVAVVTRSTDEESEDEDDEQKSDVKHITTMRYKSDDEGFVDPRPRNIWIVPTDGSDARQLTRSDAHDISPIWSPGGNEIAFVSNRTEGREWNRAREVWVVNVESGAERSLFSGDNAAFGAPSWSPDGSRLAVVGHWEAEAGGSPDDNIWVIAAAGGDPNCITESFDRSTSDSAMSDIYQASATNPIWSPDGSTIYFTSSNRGATQLCRVPSDGGSVEQLTGLKRRVSGVSLSPNGSTFAAVIASATESGDLYLLNSDGSNEQRITHVNEEFLDELALSEPEEFTVKSADGTEVQAWVMKPIGFKEGVKYPMILEIHGGPHAMYSDAVMHEFQLLAARGYVVVYCNPRGSAGYGEEFTRASHLTWGEADLPDLMAAVDHVIEQGYVDESRMGVTGGSYGGYMTLWVIGHSDRFKAAVTQRCVSNLYSFYGTSDVGWTLMGYEFGGYPWEERERFMKYSPITYVEDMKTPLLIIHSEMDFRCPIEQGEQVFISLKRLGREVEFVRFPNENHNLSRTGKPKHRIERLERLIGWFDSHL